jgi:hypothetical protein
VIAFLELAGQAESIHQRDLAHGIVEAKMTGSRLRRILSGLVLGLMACLWMPAQASGGATWVRGTVSDPQGHRLTGVTVQVSRQFFLTGLVPGLYALTARKDGYDSVSSKLNTLIDRSVTLVLPPVLGEMLPDDGAVDLPPDSGWALRLPRRDLLRDLGTEAALLPDTGASASAPSAPVATRTAGDTGSRVDGQLEQTFAFFSADGEAEGRTTQVDVGASLGSDARLSLSGLSGGTSLDTGSDANSLHKEHEHQFARLGAEFRPRPNDRVEFTALLRERSYTLVPAMAEPEDGFDQDLEGYAARWQRTLGDRGSMDVSVDYRAVEVMARAASTPSSTEDGASSVFSNADNELWQAVGSVQLDLSDRRRMSVDLRARRVNVATPGSLAMPAFQPSGSVPGDGRERWAFDLHGREERALDGPLSLDYGFRYHRRTEGVFSQASTDAFIPEAGVTIAQQDGTRWSAGISLALDTPEALFEETRSTPAGLQEDGLLSRVGYRVGVRHPFQRHDLTLALDATYHPYAYAPLYRDTPEPNLAGPLQRPFVVSEGNADSLQVGLGLEKRFRSFVAALESQLGQVEGYMATGYFDEVPVQELTYNIVRYMVASARGYRPGSGTLVHLDYQRYLNDPSDDLDLSGPPYEFERIDLGLEQELPFIALWDARWRLLVAYQTLRTDSEERADLATLRGAGVLPSESRLSGGLAIRF